LVLLLEAYQLKNHKDGPIFQPDESCLIDSEKQLLIAVAEAYNISGVDPDLAGRNNCGDHIQIAFFANGQRCLLRQWPYYCCSDAAIKFSLALQEHARDNGASIPATLDAANGCRIFDWGDSRFSIQHFVGDSYDPTRPAQLLSCATALGHYHRAVADFELAGDMRPALGEWNAVRISRHNLRILTTAVAESEAMCKDKKRLLHVLSIIEKMLEDAVQSMESLGWSNLPLVPVHGDYHQFNCRFEQDRVVGIVDFDNARFEPRLYDVAHALVEILGLEWRHECDEDRLWQTARVLEPARIAPWLSAYKCCAPVLSESEIELLPLVCAAVWPEMLNAFYSGYEAAIAGCDVVAEFMRYLLDNTDILSECVREA